MALEMRPACEKCDTATPAHGEAWICSWECTFCRNCSQAGAAPCPNCGGELVARPRRIEDPGEAAAASDR